MPLDNAPETRVFLPAGVRRAISVSRITDGPQKGKKVTVVRELDTTVSAHGDKTDTLRAGYGFMFEGLSIDGPSAMVVDPVGLPITGTTHYIETSAPIEGVLVPLDDNQKVSKWMVGNPQGADAYRLFMTQLMIACGWGTALSA